MVAEKKPQKTATTQETKQPVKSQKAKRQLPKPLRIILSPFTALGRYFKGSWEQLRLVRWPTRKATWALTLAVILFTAFYVVIIVLLDTGFERLFKMIIG